MTHFQLCNQYYEALNGKNDSGYDQHAFYEIEVLEAPADSGRWLALSRWGRIGTKGQQGALGGGAFASKALALDAAREKGQGLMAKRGYHVSIAGRKGYVAPPVREEGGGQENFYGKKFAKRDRSGGRGGGGGADGGAKKQRKPPSPQDKGKVAEEEAVGNADWVAEGKPGDLGEQYCPLPGCRWENDMNMPQNPQFVACENCGNEEIRVRAAPSYEEVYGLPSTLQDRPSSIFD
ncbi:hypothetical protein TeGR_g13708 [Tetraparma gracilis]|uniref:WGR domain-containing protein n=1 Tax=Tetraparma gracilis TaxID=2962635 RepID=A0ABQ6MS06_9STRA|nr:hypothetical protein TeGR_g13708 [Tetraparma gracilis]